MPHYYVLALGFAQRIHNEPHLRRRILLCTMLQPRIRQGFLQSRLQGNPLVKFCHSSLRFNIRTVELCQFAFTIGAAYKFIFFSFFPYSKFLCLYTIKVLIINELVLFLQQKCSTKSKNNSVSKKAVFSPLYLLADNHLLSPEKLR